MFANARSLWRGASAIGCGLIALLALAPALAYAARKPTPQERTALIRAEKASAGPSGRLEHIVVSTKGPYARGFEPGGGPDHVQGGEQLFVKRHGHWHWLVALRSEGIPCSVPLAVVSDLNLLHYGPRSC